MRGSLLSMYYDTPCILRKAILEPKVTKKNVVINNKTLTLNKLNNRHMKKLVFPFILLLLPILLKAETETQRKIALGFIASPNLSWLSTNDANIEYAGNVTGFKFGLNADFYFTPNYAFNSGLFLNSTGGKLRYNSASTEMNIGGETTILSAGDMMEYRITYLEIPLSLKLQTSDFNRFVFFGRFGFTPMVRTKAQNENKLSLIDEVNLFNLNYHIGGGLEYFISGNTGLTFSVIYSNGVIDVTKNHNNRSDYSTLNSVDFTVGINF